MSTNNGGINGASSTTTTPYVKSEKSAMVALLLCMYLGWLGLHRFYVGKIGTGLLMLITFGGFGIWVLVDVVNIAKLNFVDKHGHYLEFVRSTTPTYKIVLCVFGLFFAAIIGFVSLMTSIVMLATSGLTDAARGQLAAIRAHDYTKAYSYTTSEFQQGVTEKQFEKFISAYPALSNNKDATFNARSIDNNGIGTIEGTIQSDDGKVTPIRYQFLKENGVWKIQNIEVNPNSNTSVSHDNDATAEQPSNDAAKKHTSDTQSSDDKTSSSDDASSSDDKTGSNE